MLLAFAYLHILEKKKMGIQDPKVLVCAPSNFACDEIFKRFIREEERINIKAFRYITDDQENKYHQKWNLENSDVIISTLCSSGNDDIKRIHENRAKFSLLIIDEACQATELSTLIPFCYDIKKSIMIGDPQQLPPTVLNKKAKKCLYDLSFFKRLQIVSPNSIHLLNTQYRMHPNISKLSSKCFYFNKIKDGENVKSNKWIKKWHNDLRFQPVMFYDVKGLSDISSLCYGSSLSNEKEANEVVNFIIQLLHNFPNICFNKRISIIATYRAQVNLIKEKLRQYYEKTLRNELDKSEKELSYWKFYNKYINLNDLVKENDNDDNGNNNNDKKQNRRKLKSLLYDDINNILDRITLNTVDGFQGQENDIVILSCVRSNTNTLGILRDERRLNVSITRSRHSLIIFGDSRTLTHDKNWRTIINEIKRMKCFVSFKKNKNHFEYK